VRHPCDADEFLEVPGDELGAIVGDDAWPRRMALPSALQDALDVRLGHRLRAIVHWDIRDVYPNVNGG
jgi:hypothetical protein